MCVPVEVREMVAVTGRGPVGKSRWLGMGVRLPATKG